MLHCSANLCQSCQSWLKVSDVNKLRFVDRRNQYLPKGHVLVRDGLILMRRQRGLCWCHLLPSLGTTYAFPFPNCKAGGTPVVPFPSPVSVSPPRRVSVTINPSDGAASPPVPAASQKRRGLVLHWDQFHGLLPP